MGGVPGQDDDLYAFEAVADLVAFVRSNSDNDLVDHPGWKDLTSAHAHTFDPADDKQFDLVVVEELVSEKPTEESVNALAGALAIVSSIGSVCELRQCRSSSTATPVWARFPAESTTSPGKPEPNAGIRSPRSSGEAGMTCSSRIEEIITTPEVDEKASAKAADELAEERDEPEEPRRPKSRRRRR